jgi:arginine-tRNA-protein transferase
MYTDELY